MTYQGSDFSFSQGIHVRIHLEIDISISIRPMTTKLDNQEHLQDLTQMRPIRQGLVMSLHQDYVTY